ncbi:hypothetical protein ACEPAI_9063 [Sanghuangporus weigelae]
MPLSLWQQLVDDVSFVSACGYLAAGIAKSTFSLKLCYGDIREYRRLGGAEHSGLLPVKSDFALIMGCRWNGSSSFAVTLPDPAYSCNDCCDSFAAQTIAIDVHVDAAKDHINTTLSQHSLSGLLQMHELLGSESLPEMTYQQKVLLISKYYQLASCIVLLYDYFLTFDLETERVWGRSFAFSEVLFYLVCILFFFIITVSELYNVRIVIFLCFRIFGSSLHIIKLLGPHRRKSSKLIFK